jgi:hypothetical protein
MRRKTVITCLLACLLCGPASAYDPSLAWKTMKTAHFAIHFHTGTDELAVRVATLAEKAYSRVVGALEYAPAGRIQLVISDHSDSANGSAGVLPYNQVNLLASAPDDLSVLNDYDDYLWILLLHEITHIVHMDTVSGLPRIINLVFGRTAFPNGAQPGWFTEGLAVHMESAFSSAGRIRSSLFLMFLRTAALAGTIPTIDQLSGLMRDWPQGTAPYLYGSFFIDYIAHRFGETSLADLSHKMGGMLVPWTLNIVARDVLDLDYPTLYKQWSDTVRDQARRTLAELQRDGLTPFRFLTRRGHYQGHPRVSPGSGQVLYFSSPTDDWPSLRLVDKLGHNDHRLIEVNSDGGASFLPDGRGVVFGQSEVVDEFYFVSDLYLLDLASGRQLRLTRGLRSRSPDVSPDGRSVVFVKNMAGRTRIITARLRPKQGSLDSMRVLVDYDDGTQLYSPRFSPDGRLVVFSAAKPGGGRNLVLVDLENGHRRRITHGRYMDSEPVFSRDGRRIIFSSDRTGIYNIWSLDLENLALSRLSNLATGAFGPDPAPDGSGIAFLVYGKDGYDIAWLDDPQKNFPTSASRPIRPAAHIIKTEAKPTTTGYTPWSTLWPRAWWPVFGADQWGDTYGVMLGGRDALGKLDYQLELNYGPGNNQVYFDLGLTARVIYPTLYLYTGRRVDRYYNQALVNGYSFPVDKERLTIYGDLFFPFSSSRQSHGLFINYELQMYDRWTRVPREPDDTEPLLPDDSNLAWLGMGWSFSNVRWYAHSISAEKGLSTTLSLRCSHPSLGSGSSLVEARFWFRTYFSIWRSRHHVLALGLQAGVVMGDRRRKWVYGLGGLPIDDIFLDAYYGYRYGGLYLRGYPRNAFMGSMFGLGSMEYRFPIVDIETGVLTLPFYLRRLHAAIFVDVGEAAIDSPDLDALKVGLGAELRLDMLLAYYLQTTLRLGYARGLSAGGGNNFFLTMGWGF